MKPDEVYSRTNSMPFDYRLDPADGNSKELSALSEVDHKILNLLAEDSRLSNAEIGRIVGLSRSAAREHVMRLVDDGIIEKFTISVDPAKVGRKISVFIEVSADADKFAEVVGILVGSREVTDVYQMTGTNMIHCHALLKDSAELENFTQKILSELPGVKNIKIEVLLKRFKSRSGIRI